MHTLQPQKYLQKIGTLKNIKLTLREIDVISCVISGRITKTMSCILGIEKSTYETHYANVKKKLQINTKEHLIRLTERYASTLIYKNHVSLLKIEKNIFEYAQEQTLERRSFILQVSQNSTQLFFDLLKRHMKFFNICIQIKQVMPRSTNTGLEFIFIPTDSDNKNIKALHVHFQNEGGNKSEKKLYFKHDTEYFDFFITTIEKLNPDINTFYIKKKIRNILSKQSEGLLRIQEPARSISANHFQKSMNDMPVFKKIWILIGAITSVSSLTLLIPSFSTQTIIHNNLRSMHMLGSNENILKRDDILSSIEAAFLNQTTENPHSISYITLSGIAGSGKTTVATNYAEQQTKKFTWELNAQSFRALRQSYLQLAYSLANTHKKKAQITFLEKIKDPDVFSEQLLRFIQTNLKEQKNWLLIFDNVTNLQEIEKLLPREKNLWGHGSVIITTTNDNLENITRKQNQYIKIGALHEGQTKDLFCSIAYKASYKYIPRTTQQYVDTLLQKIPSFPLDISLAAHYIRHTNSTLLEYINKLNDKSCSANDLNTFFQQELNIPLARSSLLLVTIDSILSVDKDFQQLLYVLSRLNFKNIPKKLLQSHCNEDSVNAFILTLKKHSFITETHLPYVNNNERFISIHPFIQNYCRTYLNKTLNKNLQNTLAHSAVDGVLNYEKSLENNHHKMLNILNEHIESFLKVSPETSSFNHSDLYHLYALLGKTYYLGSRELLDAKKAFKIALFHVPSNKLDTTDIGLYLSLAHICNDMIDPKSAIHYAQKALDVLNTNNAKPAHIQYEWALFEKGIAHVLLGNTSDAEESLQLALDKLEIANTPSALKLKSQITAYRGWMHAVTNLSTEDSAINDVNAALEMITNSGTLRLDIKTMAKLRAYHYVTKGDILCKQGKFKEALSLGFAKAQEVIATNLSESPDFILNIHLQIGIGECMLRADDFKKAKNTLQDAINQGELLLGNNSPFLYAPKVLLIETLIRLKKLDSAEELLKNTQEHAATDNTIYAQFIECLLYYNAMVLYGRKGNKIMVHQYFTFFSQKIGLLYENLKLLPIEKKEDLNNFLTIKKMDTHALFICQKLLQNIYTNIKFIAPSRMKA
ncbi:MAG: hypothetical protein COY39_00595 [Alphaproteobacteria bacterium CG_4_10_14_0_8_um_filter_37_21]|nr:MAG: hypothetical protein COY39_00595 [Alphaproteobacteria bacterium CG_4_10_14_0_8_um_filter_37_21]